jgi:hypothetical protein
MLVAYEKFYIMYQILKNEYDANPWFANWKNIIIKDAPESIDKEIPVITGSDLLHPHFRNWLTNNQSGIYIGRGYVGNHLYKKRKFWRYSVNGWANTKLLNAPYSRWHLMNLNRHNWKVKEVKNVLIAPSKMTAPIWNPELGYDWAEYMSTQFPGANIRIRYKKNKPDVRWQSLWDDFDWADLIVSQGSAITAEAFWYGKKVISLYPCTTWAAEKSELSDWKNPKEPEMRDAWHEHLAWSQFSTEEWETGDAINLIEEYIGPVADYKSGHSYNFK